MGATLVRKGVRELYLFYLMLLYASSPAMATQYVAIPMLAAAVFYPAWEGWAFVAAATFANLLAKSNVGYLLFQAISRSGLMLVRGHPYNLSDLLDVSAVPFFLAASQFCVGALFLKQWRQIGKPAVTIPLWIKMRQAAILIAAGGLPVVVSVVRKTMTYGSLGR